jgi:hypothetical protein
LEVEQKLELEQKPELEQKLELEQKPLRARWTVAEVDVVLHTFVIHLTA